MAHANCDTVILDVRPSAAYEELHRTGSVNIPLEELANRIHELPRRDAPLLIYDEDERRARWARSRLRARNRNVAEIVQGKAWLADGPTATGPSRSRLWQPHKLLIEAVEIFQGYRSPGEVPPRVLDIACGTGRDAVYLALCGFDVEAWDILPDALSRCDDLARRHGVKVSTRQCDVESMSLVEGGPFDMICCFNFLHRPLMPAIAEAVCRGGLVVYETFVHPQGEMFGKPTREAHLLRAGELPAFFADWELLVSREGMTGPRRLAASLVARKPGSLHQTQDHTTPALPVS